MLFTSNYWCLSHIAVLETCFEKKTEKFVVGTWKNICTVAVHRWYIQDTFAEFCQQIFEKKKFQKIF